MNTSRERVVWLINHYTTIPSRDGTGSRHFKLAQHLPALGWRPVLFVASTRHPSGRQYLPPRVRRRVDAESGVSYVMLRTPEYRNGIARIWNMLVFALRVLSKRAARGVPAPDLVLGSTVHLFAAWAGLRLARRHTVPFVFEIRDIWPETLIDLGKLRTGGVPARLMAALSRHLCTKASLVVSPLPGVREYLDGLGLKNTPFVWVSNGVDAPEIDDPEPSGNEDFVFMYLGSHGNANGLEGLLSAFDTAHTHLRDSRQLRLRLVGEGTMKNSLRQFADNLDASASIEFEDRIPRHDVISRAREADALVVNLEDLPVYRFGISLNKLFDYMASGRPTVIATSAVNNPIADAQAGLSVPAGDAALLSEAMENLSGLVASEREEMGRRGAAHVRQQYSFEALASRLAGALDEVAGRSDRSHSRGGERTLRFRTRMRGNGKLS